MPNRWVQLVAKATAAPPTMAKAMAMATAMAMALAVDVECNAHDVH